MNADTDEVVAIMKRIGERKDISPMGFSVELRYNTGTFYAEAYDPFYGQLWEADRFTAKDTLLALEAHLSDGCDHLVGGGIAKGGAE